MYIYIYIYTYCRILHYMHSILHIKIAYVICIHVLLGHCSYIIVYYITGQNFLLSRLTPLQRVYLAMSTNDNCYA